MKFAIALCASLALATSAGATAFGVQCTPSSGDTCAQGAAGVIAVAQALHSQIIRIRVAIPHPIYDSATYGQGTSTTLSTDYDPIWAAKCTPDGSGAGGACPVSLLQCPGITAYGLKLNTTTGFRVGDAVTSDFFPNGATVCARSGFSAYITVPPTAYVAVAKLNSIAFGGAGTIALASAAGIKVDLTVFNANSGGGASDGPILDQAGTVCTSSACDAMFQARVNYMLNNLAFPTPAPPVVLSVGNEEDGGFSTKCNDGVNPTTSPQSVCLVTLTYNGDPGDGGTPNGDTTMQFYLQKLHDVCLIAHQFGTKCTDSGLMAISTQLSYWHYEFEVLNTTQSRLMADIFQQGGFSKSAGQFAKQAALPTSCNYFTPGLSNGGYNRVARYASILADDTLTGPSHADLVNTHWYDVPWQTYIWALYWLQAQSSKTLMANEFGVYNVSAVDALEKIRGARFANLVYAIWWNEDSGLSTAVATALSDPYAGTNPAQVPLRVNGQAWNSFLTTGQPNVLSSTAMPQPFC